MTLALNPNGVLLVELTHRGRSVYHSVHDYREGGSGQPVGCGSCQSGWSGYSCTDSSYLLTCVLPNGRKRRRRKTSIRVRRWTCGRIVNVTGPVLCRKAVINMNSWSLIDRHSTHCTNKSRGWLYPSLNTGKLHPLNPRLS
jgi:hypothetical protein